MKITTATHYGMCFGVRDALRKAHETARRGPATVLGQLVHNPLVSGHLRTLGLREGSLEDTESSGTNEVVITAHGAADRHREAWKAAGFSVTDTTCPLVRKAHTALAQLAARGCRLVVVGQAGHVEVRGLTGDFPGAAVVLTEAEVDALEFAPVFGIISQTTQPLARVRELVECLKRRHPAAEVIFRDTVCQPTKDRQTALEELCRTNEMVIVVGGRHSNNTRQLADRAARLGAKVYQVECAEDLQASWFAGVETVGVTAGTSTLDETVQEVTARIRELEQSGKHSAFAAAAVAGVMKIAAI